MDILILLFLVFLNGMFVMSEIALVSARKPRLESQAERGDRKAKQALDLANNPEIFLSAAQIGITLIAILTGVYSGERFGKNFQPVVEKIAILRPYAATIAVTIIVILVTFLSLTFGELIPKRIGLLKAERIAKVVAGPMRVFAKITHPIVWLLNLVSNLFFSIFNIRRSQADAVTEDEIKAMVTEGTEAGTIDQAEQAIIERVFHLGDRNITSLMTHRSDIIWFNLDDNEEKVKKTIISHRHSFYPICDGDIDQLQGIVSIKDLYIADDSTVFRELMKPALFVPENNSAYQVLEKFKESQQHTAFIVDEYGTILGMITINDILEAIVGDMPQPDLQDYGIKKREDGSFLIDGQIPFYNFLSYFGKADWQSEGEQEFDTLAGFILHELERIPGVGERMEWRGFGFEIVDMDGHRIDKILVTASDEIKDELAE